VAAVSLANVARPPTLAVRRLQDRDRSLLRRETRQTSAPVDAAIIVALIALLGTVGNASLTYVLQRRRELEKSDAIWARYRASLASAAEDLSNRIENILRGDFLDFYVGRPYENEAIHSTLFLFAQYFGWSEVLRRYMRSPDRRHARDDRKLEDLRRRVAHTFSTERYGSGFMIWREAQRAVGELMITRDGDVIDTVGVAEFVVAIERVRPWMSRMEQLITTSPSNWGPGERERLEHLQAVLGQVANEAPSTSNMRAPASLDEP
jgi:hypothetical protein